MSQKIKIRKTMNSEAVKNGKPVRHIELYMEMGDDTKHPEMMLVDTRTSEIIGFMAVELYKKYKQ